MLRVVLMYENSVYGAVCIKDDAVRKRLIRGAPWGATRAPGREGVRLGCHEPLDGCMRRRKKGHNSMRCIFLFSNLLFFSQSVRKEVWVEVPEGTKHPPVLLEVLIGVGR